MHELSYVVRFVDRAIALAEEHHAKTIQKLIVQVGEMTDVVPAYLQKYYPEAIRGTILEGSVLEVEPLPAKIHCNSCGTNFHPAREQNYLCPACKSGNGRVVEGRHVLLKEVVMETNP